MFLAFKREVEDVLKKAVEKAGYEGQDLSLEEPGEIADLASSIAFKLAPKYKKTPNSIAQELKKHVQLEEYSLIEKVEIAGAYINFHASKLFLEMTLREVERKQEAYGKLPRRGEKIILEHTSANPTGPLHVGRGRNPVIGDTLARLLRAAGYDVEVQYYVNDMGKQVAAIVWGYDHIDPKTLEPREYEKPDYEVVQYYRKAASLLEEDPEVEEEISRLLTQYEEGEVEVREKFKKVVEKCIAGQMQTLRRLNVTYDKIIWESQFIFNSDVKKVVEEIAKSKAASIRDGALILNLSEFGLEKEFVITRGDGTTLYTTRDIAYHLWKFSQADIAINVLGEDQKLAMEQLNAALKILNVQKKPLIVYHSFVTLPIGRMSTRKGVVVNFDDLIEEAIARAYIEVDKRRKELPEAKKREIAEMVGIGAVRFDIVKVASEKGITFSWEQALDFEKQGAPFIQYAHARACSIFEKAREANLEFNENFNPALLIEKEEIALIKKISKLSSVIETAAKDLKPHLLATYARELAESFNQFYRYIPVLSAETEELRKARLGLVDCARIALQNTLELLGIAAPKSM
ncbi:MAG: arginine--tRNA ligase [Halobacteria archaeon]